MNHRDLGVSLVVGALTFLNVVAVPLVFADSTNGDIFYSTFSGNDRVFKRSYTFDGTTTLTYGLESVISTIVPGGLSGADGLVFDPTNTSFLIVGGQDGHFNRVNVGTGVATQSTDFFPLSGATIYHLAIDPSGTSVWGAGIPGSPIVNLSLTPFNSGSSTLPISGAVSAITGLAFDGAGTAYYTSSVPAGGSDFGTISLITGVTTPILGAGSAAHGLIFDSFTGNLILTGDSEVKQFDPVGGTFVSTLSLPGNQFDQGTTDGKGHLFVASNDGHMLFVDYHTSKLVGDASNFVNLDTTTFPDTLDDVAPLSGPGSQNPVPEPTSLLLFGLGGLGVGLVRRRRTQIA